MKRINIIFFAIFLDIVIISFATVYVHASPIEIPPQNQGYPLNLYPPSSSILGTSGNPITVPAGYCPEPFTVNIPLVDPQGISLQQSDFTPMLNYLSKFSATTVAEADQIISACQISPGLYKCDPRFLAAIWGQESSFSTGGGAGESFNCFGGEAQSFSPELTCAINSIMTYYNTFTGEMNNQKIAIAGAGTSAACKTTDLFTYMMEEYTPINGSQFGNSSTRSALNTFLTIFLGPQAIVTG